MDDTEFQKRLQGVATQLNAPQAPPSAQPSAPASQAAPELPSSDPRKGLQANGMPAPEPGLGDPTSLDAIAGGALKSGFETKDFLFGDTPPERQSDFRRNVEDTVSMRSEESMLDGFAAGVSQFATAMIGLGKLSKVAQAVPAIKGAVTAVASGHKGVVALEVAKAATAGAIAFDPHDARLSNLVQDTPFANPINGWLAADPEDSAAAGRLKAAFESIGLDVTLGTVFMGAGAIWKALKRGDTAGAGRIATQLEEDAARAIDAEDAVPSPEVAPSEPVSPAVAPDAPPVDLERIKQDFGQPIIDERYIPEDVVGSAPAGVAQRLGAVLEANATKISAKDVPLQPESQWAYVLGPNGDVWKLNKAEHDDFFEALRDGSPATDETLGNAGGFAIFRVSSGSKGGPMAGGIDFFGQPSPKQVQTFRRMKRAMGDDPEAFSISIFQRGEAPNTPAPTPPELEANIAATVTATPTQAAAEVGGDMKSRDRAPAIKLTDEDTKAVYEGMVADTRAIATHGGDMAATIENGHVFAQGAGVPYEKLNNAGELEHFVDRITEQVAESLDAAKGGVVTDKALSANALDILKLYNLDPAEFMGVIQQAGREANTVAAKMEAGFIVSNRMFQDAYALSIRSMMGDFSAFGGNAAAADEALRQRLTMAASVYGATKSMSSNAGRTLRRMRSEFGVDQELVSRLGTIDPQMLKELVANTGGNPRKMAKLAQATKLSKTMDFLQFLYINNLVSGPKTQLINIISNSYMLGARPLERIIGGVTTGNSRLVRESLKQYTYMGNAAYEGFQLAAQAFRRGDSILTPHKSELYIANNLGGQAGGAGSTEGFKPWNNLPNVTGNALRSVGVAIGLPTRVLGTVDELMKQTTYRSMVSSKAYFDGVERGVEAGLTGAPLKAFATRYAEDALDNAFDAQGRGTNVAALHEANVATFQNELLPQTWGKTFQSMVTAHPEARIVLPFVKTPTNVIRMGVKMSPGLNLLQSEYRAMLNGEMGEAAKAQAIGQVALGTLFTASAGFMVAQGGITGAGPSDPEAASAWRSTGAMPYSLVVENEDGTKSYIPYGRLDPIAIPMGIIADLQDALLVQEGSDKIDTEIESAITALTMSMASQFKNKAYLMGISQFMDAVAQPGTNGEKLQRYMGQVGSNFVPFASGLRQFSGDPYLREARTLADKVMTTVPGLGEGLPARHDAWGDPILGRKGLWTTDNNDLVDREMQRLAMTGFSVVGRPTPYHGAVDLRDIVMSDGKNAYDVYAGLTGHLPNVALSLKDQVRRLMETDAYKAAPDGDMGVRGTKLWLLHTPVSTYREAALKIIKVDPVVREAIMSKELKVMDFYKQRPGASAPAPTSKAPAPEANPLADLGSAFGVDLEGLIGPISGNAKP